MTDPRDGIIANLQGDLAAARAEIVRLRRAEDLVWELWCREVRPGWRMWRIKRRAVAREEHRTWLE